MIRSLTAIALAVSVAATPAFAATDDFQIEIDLNRSHLETVEGARTEYNRVRDEVHTRCAAEHDNFRFAKSYVVGQCERQTMKKVVAYVDDANFTDAHFAYN